RKIKTNWCALLAKHNFFRTGIAQVTLLWMLVEVLLQHIFSPSNAVFLDAVGKKICVGVQVDFEGQDLAHTHTANDREDAVFDTDGIQLSPAFTPARLKLGSEVCGPPKSNSSLVPSWRACLIRRQR